MGMAFISGHDGPNGSNAPKDWAARMQPKSEALSFKSPRCGRMRLRHRPDEQTGILRKTCARATLPATIPETAAPLPQEANLRSDLSSCFDSAIPGTTRDV
jgi:hypothetical protein